MNQAVRWRARPRRTASLLTSRIARSPRQADTVTTDLRRRAAFIVYASQTAGGFDESSHRRTLCHWLSFGLTILGTWMALAMAYYLFLLGMAHKADADRVPPHLRRLFVITYLLLIMYIPLGIYVEGYQHYYSLAHLQGNVAKLLVIALGAAGLVLVLAVLGRIEKALPWLGGAVSVLPGVPFITWPKTISWVSGAVEQLPVSAFVGFCTPLAFLRAAIGGLYLTDDGVPLKPR